MKIVLVIFVVHVFCISYSEALFEPLDESEVDSDSAPDDDWYHRFLSVIEDQTLQATRFRDPYHPKRSRGHAKKDKKSHSYNYRFVANTNKPPAPVRKDAPTTPPPPTAQPPAAQSATTQPPVAQPMTTQEPLTTEPDYTISPEELATLQKLLQDFGLVPVPGTVPDLPDVPPTTVAPEAEIKIEEAIIKELDATPPPPPPTTTVAKAPAAAAAPAVTAAPVKKEEEAPKANIKELKVDAKGTPAPYIKDKEGTQMLLVPGMMFALMKAGDVSPFKTDKSPGFYKKKSISVGTYMDIMDLTQFVHKMRLDIRLQKVRPSQYKAELLKEPLFATVENWANIQVFRRLQSNFETVGNDQGLFRLGDSVGTIADEAGKQRAIYITMSPGVAAVKNVPAGAGSVYAFRTSEALVRNATMWQLESYLDTYALHKTDVENLEKFFASSKEVLAVSTFTSWNPFEYFATMVHKYS